MKSSTWNSGTVKVKLAAACPYCQWTDELEVECGEAPCMRCFVVCESCETLFLVELSREREVRTFRVEPRIEIIR
jgi:hypothetical protein